MSTRMPFPPAIGVYRCLIVPMLEPGQTFRDGNLGRLANTLRHQLFNKINNFFDENSFGLLDVQADVFGHDVIPMTDPLLLPQAIADYWNPAFEAGGLDARETGLGAAATIVFDGTEAAELHVVPRLRPADDLDITFSAVSAESNHGDFPVTINFLNSDQLQLRLTDKDGTVQNLTVGFTNQSFTITATDLETDLADVAAYLDGRIQAATTPLGLPAAAPTLLQPVRLSRIGSNPLQLGTLVLDLAVHADYGDGSARIETTGVTGLADLNLSGSQESSFSLPGDRINLQQYLRRRLEIAQEIAGYNEGNRLLDDANVLFFAGALTVELRLSDADGGVGSSLQMNSQARLEKVGFDNVTVVPGVATAGDSATVNDAQDLINDIFTQVNNAIGAGDQTGWIINPARDYRAIYIVFLGTPPAANTTWDADAANVAGLRMFKWYATAVHNADNAIQLQGNWITSVLQDDPDDQALGTACHELGHTLGGEEGTFPGGKFMPHDWCFGLPDTYDNDPENQNQLLYYENWDLMSASESLSHIAGFHKKHLNWIPDPRIHRVGLPDPTGTIVEECWLVPIEYWDSTMDADVRAVVGGTLPIRQLVEITLPGDGGRFLLVEARAAGDLYSHNLPTNPALLISDVIDCADSDRYVVNYKYRRYAHPLNINPLNSRSDLDSDGDSFDLAAAPELPHEGITVAIVERRMVGGMPVFHTRIEREQADFIDLHFMDPSPPWRSPDLWVNWPGNGDETYPVGSPYDQGEAVRFPLSGTEPHEIVARVHNKGTVQALNVDVRFYIWEPAGAGDRGEFTFLDSDLISVVDAADFELAKGLWDVTPSTNAHRCILAQIHDWDIPTLPGGGPVPVYTASTDLWLHNNRAQQNIVDFELKTSSPYQPYFITLEIANDAPEDIQVYLEPIDMPHGYRIACKPRTLTVPAKDSSQFVLRVEAERGIVQPNSEYDAIFVIHALRWTRDKTNMVPFGGWVFMIRPREETDVSVNVRPDPPAITVTGVVSGANAGDTVYVRLADSFGQPLIWSKATVATNGVYTATFEPIPATMTAVQIEVHFDGNNHLAAATAGPVPVNLPAITPGVGGGGSPIGDGGVVVGAATDHDHHH